MRRLVCAAALALLACAHARPADDCYKEAVHALSAGRDRPRALALLEEALRADPSHRDARMLRAGLLASLGRLEEALAEYGEVLARRPKDAAALLARARVHGELGHVAEAERDFAAALAIYPHYVEAYLHRGQFYRSLGRAAEAERDFAEARRIGAEMAEAFFNEGVKELHLGRDDDAFRHFSFAIELRPGFVPAYVGRGRIHFAAGRALDAVRDFSKAIELAPDRADLLLHRGHALLAAGRPDEALADFDAALAKDARLAPAFVGRGIVFRLRREYEKAERELTRAIELEPDRPEPRLERARVYFDWKLLADAERDVRESLRRRSSCEGLHFLGLVLLEKGEPARAIRAFEAALQAAPAPPLRRMIETDLARAHKEKESEERK